MIQDPLVNLGKLIRTSREKSEMTLDQLAQLAKVSVGHVSNIESADRKSLPEGTYLYGYLKKILKTLKFSNYEKLIGDYKELEASFVLQQMLMETEIHELNDRDESFSLNNYFSIKHLIIVFTILALVLVLVILRFKFITGIKIFPRKQVVKKVITTPEHVDSTLLVSKVKEMEETIVTPPEPSPKVIYGGSGKQHLRLLIAKPAWIKVVAVRQDRVIYQGNISPSKIIALELRDDEGFEVSTNNAAALMIDTGKKTSPLGANGQNLQWYYPRVARAIYRHRQRENLRKAPSPMEEERL